MALSGWAVFIIVVILLAGLGYGGWVLWSRRRASNLGLPAPSLNPFKRSSGGPSFPTPRTGGLVGWVNDKIRAFKNRRYAAGAYEEGRDGGGGGVPRGAGSRLDPDEAWDARVGNEAYYEEQELGLHAPTAYGGNGYGAPSSTSNIGGAATHQPSPYISEPERGRSRNREYDAGFEEDHSGRARTPVGTHNPFGDHAEPSNISLRGVSPRPIDTSGAAAASKHSGGGNKSANSSPTERRSMFREDM